MSDVTDAINAVTGGFSLKDVATAFVDIKKAELGAGMAAQSNTIDQLKGTVSLLAQQNAAQAYQQRQQATQTAIDLSGFAKWAVLGVGVYLVWKMVK